MRAPVVISLGVGWALSGCEPTEECRRLEAAVEQAEAALNKVKLRAAMREKIEKHRDAAKEKAEKILGAYGLDQPEEQLTATFEARAAAHEGVSVTRTTRKTKAGPEIDPNTYDTVWRFEISRRPFSELFDVMDQLAASPPIARLSLFQIQPDGSYALELTRITLPEAPGDPRPAPLPPVPDVSTIPVQWGFCGAGRMRSRVEEIAQEIDALAEDARATTVAMPTGSTWEAKGVRAQQKGALERGGRKVFASIMQVVARKKLPLVAMGLEDEAVVAEFRGDAVRLEERLRRALPDDVADGLAPLPSPRDALARFTVPNPAFEEMKPPGAGGEGGLGGLPSPEVLRREHDRHQH